MKTSLAQGQSTPVAHLEASYPAYCQSLRILIRDSTPLGKIKRTACWRGLELLHNACPEMHEEPFMVYRLIKDEMANLLKSVA